MSTPNPEQKLAIEHDGGVLLKAGAGSGKTFVLKEHMIYLTNKIIHESKELGRDLEDFSNEIRSFYRKTVLVTFTKKAAGELEIRLVNEFKEKAAGIEDKEFWESATSALDYLTVSTIHGFCFKLIKLGLFEGVSADEDILTESEFQYAIKDILDAWFESRRDSSVSDLLLKNKKSLYGAMFSIFSDPTIRKSWKELDESFKVENVNEAILELAALLNLDLGRIEKPFIDEGFKGKKWYDFLVEFETKRVDFTPDLKGMVSGFKYFENRDFKMPPKPRGKAVEENIIRYYEQIKNYKDYIKKNGKDFYLYEKHFLELIYPWFKEIKNLVDYIDKEYVKRAGITFSDLEYIVYEGLKNKETQRMVQEQFSYFIVDEFQDTSYIQFEILQKVVGNDFSKLFCVGDLKQAIYGFRGGELGVFMDCEKMMPKTLSLKNNYRSKSDVINFNNNFFEYLFDKGPGFVGEDIQRVEVEYQNVPEHVVDTGSIYSIDVDVEDGLFPEKKLSNLDMDYIESLALLVKIKENLGEETCILYKRLKPSLILINKLIEEDIGFTAQVKIPFLEDPIIGIFDALLSRKFNSSKSSGDYMVLLINTYLNLLGVSGERFAIDLYADFEGKSSYYGLEYSYFELLTSLGIKTSNYKNNLEYINKLIDLARGNLESLLNLLKEQREVSYSLDFQYGKDSKLIKIMTAHASKGLQFQHVLLGGMYTNDNMRISKGLIGKYPASFKWSLSIEGKEKFKTPSYMLEEEMEKRKEFSETKRLFYVANTRAEETLGWVNIRLHDLKRMKAQKGSWIEGINSYRENVNDVYIKYFEKDIKNIFSHKDLEKNNFRPPFFHVDDLGITTISESANLIVLPELAVTRLSMLSECPRKFYFKNVCKFEDSEMLNISESSISDEGSSEEFISDDLSQLNSTNIKSSAGRGSYIHEKLSEIIISNFNEEKISGITKYKKEIFWTVEKLRENLEKSIFISENPIKFELLGYMISGIPDLIIQKEDLGETLEIWDFKTGSYSAEKLESYRFQLFCYAYSQFVLKQVELDSHIKIVLCYIDDRKIVEENVSFKNVEKVLVEMIAKADNPDLFNKAYCDYCSFTSICNK